MSDQNLLSQNLRYLRKSHKLSQTQLADKLGLTRSKVASYENGKAEPSAQTLLNMIEFFQLGLRSLIQRDLQHYDQLSQTTHEKQNLNTFDRLEMVQRLEEEAMQLRSIAAGYKAMLELRKMNRGDNERLLSDRDFETIIDFMEVALASNEQSINLAKGLLSQAQNIPSYSQPGAQV